MTQPSIPEANVSEMRLLTARQGLGETAKASPAMIEVSHLVFSEFNFIQLQFSEQTLDALRSGARYLCFEDKPDSKQVEVPGYVQTGRSSSKPDSRTEIDISTTVFSSTSLK